MGEDDFDAAWAEGAAMSTENRVCLAQRGRGARKRPSTVAACAHRPSATSCDWSAKDSPTESIATRLFVSPRTVQAPLTHVYTELGLTSRVQLAQEAARRG